MTIYNHIEDVTSIRGATDKYQKYWQMFGNENYLSTSQLLTNNKDFDNFQILTYIEAWVNNIQLLTNIENLEWTNVHCLILNRPCIKVVRWLKNSLLWVDRGTWFVSWQLGLSDIHNYRCNRCLNITTTFKTNLNIYQIALVNYQQKSFFLMFHKKNRSV